MYSCFQAFMLDYVNAADWGYQFLPETAHVFEASYSTLVTWAGKKSGLDQSELGNLSSQSAGSYPEH